MHKPKKSNIMGKSKNDFMQVREAEEVNLPVTIKHPSNATEVDIYEMEQYIMKGSNRGCKPTGKKAIITIRKEK